MKTGHWEPREGGPVAEGLEAWLGWATLSAGSLPHPCTLAVAGGDPMSSSRGRGTRGPRLSYLNVRGPP